MTSWHYPKGVPRVALPDEALSRRQAPQKPSKSRKPGSAVQPESVFLEALRQAGLPTPHREFRFDAHSTPQRQWRFDYAWPQYGVALEVEGGAWVKGRHTRGTGFIADLEKYSEAGAQGWLLIRVTPQQLCEARTIGWVRRAVDHIIQRSR